MGKFRNSIFYVGIIGGFSALVYWILLLGAKLEQGRHIVSVESGKEQWAEFIDSLVHNLQHPLALLLAQIVTIIFAARIFGWICVKIRQPAVIGEMIAGIVLGPSLVGMYFPEFSAMLFPAKSLPNLQFLSQIGLILFMYIVGMELDLSVLRNKAHEAVVVSHASIIVPFAMGVGLSYYVYEQFAPSNIEFLSFALFVGIAMSVTAFPVLARIVQERGIHKTKLGTIVITCAAADDVTAWCILAAVIAIVKAGSFVSALYTIAFAVAYVLLMIQVVRPFLKRVGDLHSDKESLSKPIVAIFFLTLIISAYATEIIGIHALFGAFMAGAIMPENIKFRHIFIEKIEDVALVILLPLFFVFTGLRTQIGLLNDAYLWQMTGVIILVAVAGKFIGSAIAAKVVGQSWKDSLTIGALMNTRGLMELVVLNIGYDLGVLTPEIFAMMVIMALTTTFMTGPALDLINYLFKKKENYLEKIGQEISKYRILFSFDNAELGRTLLKLADGLTSKLNDNGVLTAMHLSNTNELHHYDIEQYEKESFRPLIEESAAMNKKITTLFKASSDIDSEISNAANQGGYDLLLIGLGQSIYEGSLLGKVLGFTTRIINPEKLLNTVTGRENIFDNSPFDDRTQNILAKTQVPVGILMDKDLEKIQKVLLYISSEKDVFLFDYVQKLVHNAGAQLTLHSVPENNIRVKQMIAEINTTNPGHVVVNEQRVLNSEFMSHQDLLVVSIDTWKDLIDNKVSWLTDIPSTLIISPGN